MADERKLNPSGGVSVQTSLRPTLYETMCSYIKSHNKVSTPKLNKSELLATALDYYMKKHLI